MALLSMPNKLDLETLDNLLPTSPDYRSYAFEGLLKAFIAEWKLIKKYPQKEQVKNHLSWADPFVTALSVAPGERAEALARYMKSWGRLMTSYDWKPKRVYWPLDAEGMQIDPECNGDRLFFDFAF